MKKMNLTIPAVMAVLLFLLFVPMMGGMMENPFSMADFVWQKRQESFSAQYFDYFDTFTTFTVYADDEEQFKEYAAAFEEELKACHQKFNIYESYPGINNIKTINDNAGITPVRVDAEILDLLEFSREKYEETGGKINVAMGSVLSLWHDCREAALANPEEATIPDEYELKQAAAYTDIENMVINRQKSTVYLTDTHVKLDVGAVAKGYTAQRVSEKLQQMGVSSALISIGGNVQAIGAKADREPWRVGIQDPNTQSVLLALNLQGMALVTSGTYQRYYEIDGVRYHHIIDPDTWMPRYDYQSVTILCPDGREADALSTAVFNMTLAEGQSLVESLPDTEAFWVLADGKQVCSPGFNVYVKQ